MNKLALILICFATHVVADDAAMDKYRSYTPQQIAAIPDEQRKGQVPIVYVFAAREGIAPWSTQVFARHLNMLMYPGVSAYEKAIKQFQRDLGEPQTGVLTVGQIDDLDRRAGLQELSVVIFPNQYYAAKSDATAIVEGAVILLDERIAYPINHTSISCNRLQNVCTKDQVELVIPGDDSWGMSYNVSHTGLEYYDIIEWAEQSITAKYRGTPTDCRTTTMEFNFTNDEFYFITKNTGKECEIMGATVPPLEKPRVAQVVDGSGIINKEFTKVRERAHEVRSSEYRAAWEAAIQKARAEIGEE